MPKAKEGNEYVCGVCGTSLLVTECGTGYLEDIICCAKPMEAKATKHKKGKPKKVAKKR